MLERKELSQGDRQGEWGCAEHGKEANREQGKL